MHIEQDTSLSGRGILDNLLWDDVICCFDLLEELLRVAIIEGELTIEHGV